MNTSTPNRDLHKQRSDEMRERNFKFIAAHVAEARSHYLNYMAPYDEESGTRIPSSDYHDLMDMVKSSFLSYERNKTEASFRRARRMATNFYEFVLGKGFKLTTRGALGVTFKQRLASYLRMNEGALHKKDFYKALRKRLAKKNRSKIKHKYGPIMARKVGTWSDVTQNLPQKREKGFLSLSENHGSIFVDTIEGTKVFPYDPYAEISIFHSAPDSYFVHEGRILDEEDTLEMSGVKPGDTIHERVRIRGGGKSGKDPKKKKILEHQKKLNQDKSPKGKEEEKQPIKKKKNKIEKCRVCKKKHVPVCKPNACLVCEKTKEEHKDGLWCPKSLLTTCSVCGGSLLDETKHAQGKPCFNPKILDEEKKEEKPETDAEKSSEEEPEPEVQEAKLPAEFEINVKLDSSIFIPKDRYIDKMKKVNSVFFDDFIAHYRSSQPFGRESVLRFMMGFFIMLTFIPCWLALPLMYPLWHFIANLILASFMVISVLAVLPLVTSANFLSLFIPSVNYISFWALLTAPIEVMYAGEILFVCYRTSIVLLLIFWMYYLTERIFNGGTMLSLFVHFQGRILLSLYNGANQHQFKDYPLAGNDFSQAQAQITTSQGFIQDYYFPTIQDPAERARKLGEYKLRYKVSISHTDPISMLNESLVQRHFLKQFYNPNCPYFKTNRMQIKYARSYNFNSHFLLGENFKGDYRCKSMANNGLLFYNPEIAWYRQTITYGSNVTIVTDLPVSARLVSEILSNPLILTSDDQDVLRSRIRHAMKNTTHVNNLSHLEPVLNTNIHTENFIYHLCLQTLIEDSRQRGIEMVFRKP
jgi:hypothetical protein